MASRRLALVCCSKGPWVSTVQIPRPALRVTGLKQGDVKVTAQIDGAEVTSVVSENGDHAMPPAPFMRVELTHPSRSVICEIIATPKVA